MLLLTFKAAEKPLRGGRDARGRGRAPGRSAPAPPRTRLHRWTVRLQRHCRAGDRPGNSASGRTRCRDRLSTRIILVDSRPADHDLQRGEGQPCTRGNRSRLHVRQCDRRTHRPWLLGLIAEQVSDVASVKPEQIISASMQLPQAPYLGAIVDIDHQMIQLMATGPDPRSLPSEGVLRGWAGRRSVVERGRERTGEAKLMSRTVAGRSRPCSPSGSG